MVQREAVTGSGSGRVQFCVLGPLAVVDGPDQANLGGVKQRTVLALLIAGAGRAVSNDAIADAVYDDEAEGRARRRIQTYVSNLRSIVGDVIVREGTGWSLRVDRDQIDALRFEDLYESVRDNPDLSDEQAARVLREALSLWRGHPYSDVEAHGHLDGEVARLSQLRLAAQAARIDADLGSGRHGDLIGEIEALMAEHPYMERFRAQHMLALYRAGRQREALRSFEEMRSLLVDEMGVDPTLELRDLEHRILDQDESLQLAPRRQIQRKAVLVADPGDPMELARLPIGTREAQLADAAELLRRVVSGGSGDGIVHAGAASFVVFDSVTDAVSAAERIVQADQTIGLRVAVDHGDIEASVDAVAGVPVSRAAVLVSVAHPGQVLLSAEAQQAIAAEGDGPGLRFESLGRHDLVGIAEPVPVFQLLTGDPPSLFPPLETDRIPVPVPDGGERSIPGYELRDPIGPGSVGVRYHAYQPAVGREVVVEVIGRAESSSPTFIRNFEADAQRLALLDHPDISPLIDYWRDTEGAFLVHRHHRGGTLADRLRDNADGSGVDADRVVRQVGSALAYAHSYGVVHGSLRPDRVMLDESGNAYVIGFPVGGVRPASSTDAAAYIAPETLAGHAASVATDVYALGVLAHQLSGARLDDDGLLAPESPVVARAVAEDPADRFESVAAFLDAFAPSDGDSAARQLTATRNPYKGLTAFHESDAGDFHGRSTVIGELVEGFSRSSFLAVVGPSGVGKSSVVRAGLVPALRRGAIPSSETWVITDMLPGSHPFLELHRALERVAVELPVEVRERFAGHGPDVLAGLDRVLPDGSELVVLIDQFEELFTMTDETTATAFLDMLTVATAHGHARFVVTLRADFLDRPLLYSRFGELLRSSMVALRSPDTSELAEAIVNPARGVGVRIDPAVVERITTEAHDRPGALPLLQYALAELFDTRTADLIGLDDHDRIGGVTGSLARRAETIHTALDPAARTALRQVFLRLVTVVDDSAPTRRRIRVTQLDDLHAEPVIDAFARNRMLVFDNDPDTRAPTVEIAHEALISHWPRLAGWIDAAREDLTLHRRLDEAITDWEANDRDDNYLLARGRLAQHRAWTATTTLALTQRETDYLTRSTEREHQERTRRRRLRRAILAGFGVAALVATAFGIAALQQASEADDNAARARANAAAAETAAAEARTAEARAEANATEARTAEATAEAAARRADQERATAEARGLVAEASAVVGKDPELALVLALTGATRLDDDPLAVRALRQALSASRTILYHSGPGSEQATEHFAADVSGDGTRVVIGNITGIVTMRDIDSGEELWTVDLELGQASSGETLLAETVPFYVNDDREVAVGVFYAGFDRDTEAASAMLASAGLHILDSSTGEVLRHYRGGLCGLSLDRQQVSGTVVLARINTAEWEADNACELRDDVGRFGQSYWIDVNTGDMQPAGPVFNVYSALALVTRAPDTSLQLVYDATVDPTVTTIEDVDSDVIVARFERPRSELASSVALSPDGATALLGYDLGPPNGAIDVVDVTTGETRTRLEGHPGGHVAEMIFADDGGSFVSLGGDGNLKIWSLSPDRLVATIPVGDSQPSEFALSDDRRRVVVSAADHARVISLDDAELTDAGTLPTCDGTPVFHLTSGLRTGGTNILARTVCAGSDWVTDEVFDIDTRLRVGMVDFTEGQSGAISPDGTRVASQRFIPPTDSTPPLTGTVVVTDLGTGETVEMQGICASNRDLGFVADDCRGSSSPAYARELAFSPDGRLLAMASDFGGAGRVWDAETGEQLAAWPFGLVAFSPDGSRVATASVFEVEFQIRDTETFEVIVRRPLTLPEQLGHMEFSADGKSIVSTGPTDLYFYDADTLEVTDRILSVHESFIRHMAISADRTMFATGGQDGFARVWSTETHQLLDEIPVDLTDRVQAVAFAADDTRLIASTPTGPVRIYSLAAAELVDFARTRLVRELTPNECTRYFPDEPCPTLTDLRSG